MVGRLVAILSVLLVTACAPSVDPNHPLLGTWVGTSPNQPGEITVTFSADGSFTWSVYSGMWRTEATSLTFSFPGDSSFCPNGSIIWEYQVDGDTLTSDEAGGSCGDELGPPSPDWTFIRQSGP